MRDRFIRFLTLFIVSSFIGYVFIGVTFWDFDINHYHPFVFALWRAMGFLMFITVVIGDVKVKSEYIDEKPTDEHQEKGEE